MTKANSNKLPYRVKDEQGNVYDKLTVLEYIGSSPTNHKAVHWLCRCECGNLTKVAGGDLRRGGTKSCGCLRSSQGGGSKTPTYTAWRNMKNRCYNRKIPCHHLYGGRGITICDRWRESFLAFLADMGPKPFPEASIDRIDNEGNYSCGQCPECQRNQWPMNCRWATRLEQSQNRRNTRMLTYGGETMCLGAWARRLGIDHTTLAERIKRGWPEDRIFSPIKHHRTA